jgi:hypothetical protein
MHVGNCYLHRNSVLDRNTISCRGVGGGGGSANYYLHRKLLFSGLPSAAEALGVEEEAPMGL